MKKFHLASNLAPALVLVGLSVFSAPVLMAQAAAAPSSADSITIKDPAEYNAYQNATTQTSPQAKASASESFLQTYPNSVVKKAVLDGLVDAYSQYDQAKTIDAAQRLLKLDPNNLKAMFLIAFIEKQQASAAAATKPPDTAKQAQLLDDAAAIAQKGLTATKPADVKDDDFKKQKDSADQLFHSVIADDDLYSKKDPKAAIAEFRTELEEVAKSNPDATKSGPALNDTLFLGQTYAQLSPPDMVNAVWFLARAEDFAPANYKPVIDKQARYWYKRFHGKEDGFDTVLAAAQTSVFPPADFKIDPAPTPKDIADNVVATTPDLSTLALGDKEYILSNASKDNAEKLWALLKDQVTQIPGTVLAATANQIQVAVTEDAKTDKKPDFTVNMKTPLPDKDIPAVGSDETNLIGTYDSYTQDPPQIIMRDGELQVEKKPTPRKPSAAHKKASSVETTPSGKNLTAAQKAAIARRKAKERQAAAAGNAAS
jgi:hypothetical protein